MIYKRDESCLRNVPNIVPSLMFLDIILCLVSIILVLVGLIVKPSMIIIGLVTLGMGISFSVFCDNFFNWFIGYTYDLSKSNQLICKYRLNGYGISEKETMIIIKKVDSYIVKGKKIRVKGDIVKKIPYRPNKCLTKVDLQYDFGKEAQINIQERLELLKGA